MTYRQNLHPWLAFDPDAVVEKIRERMLAGVMNTMKRQGAVVAVSGGIDSSVCAALAQRALGSDRVLALLMPETDSSGNSGELGIQLCRHLGIAFEVQDISGTLEAIGCYRWRDSAIRSVFPEYTSQWKNKIVLSQGQSGSRGLNFFKIVVESPRGERMERRIPHKAYLQIVAATNFKQRIRKTLEYFHADRLNYCVVGTPNRLEYDQGFFVKNGDGSADIKPIAHLYKSQVYELGRFLGLPERICSATPTTDTYSLEQGQDEFYFVLPYREMDLVLYGLNHGKTAAEVGTEIGMDAQAVERAYSDILTKRQTTRPLHLKPLLIEDVPVLLKDTTAR